MKLPSRKYIQIFSNFPYNYHSFRHFKKLVSKLVQILLYLFTLVCVSMGVCGITISQDAHDQVDLKDQLESLISSLHHVGTGPSNWGLHVWCWVPLSTVSSFWHFSDNLIICFSFSWTRLNFKHSFSETVFLSILLYVSTVSSNCVSKAILAIIKPDVDHLTPWSQIIIMPFQLSFIPQELLQFVY